jgi:hypothetical protein
MWVGCWGFVWCVCVDVGFVCFVQLMFNNSDDDARRGELRASGFGLSSVRHDSGGTLGGLVRARPETDTLHSQYERDGSDLFI